MALERRLHAVTGYARAAGTLSAAYASSLLRPISKAHLDEVERYVMFIGYPRSGHTLVGQLLNAHPEAVVSHELGALQYVRQGFSRRQLFTLIVRLDRHWVGVGADGPIGPYLVPGQWQGRFRRLRLIGDKKGGNSTLMLDQHPAVLDRLRRRVDVPLRVVHIVRNPYDNLATYAKRTRRAELANAVPHYLRLAEAVGRIRTRLDPEELFEVRHEDLIDDAPGVLTALREFVGLPDTEGWLDDCSKLVFRSPHRSRLESEWDADTRSQVDAAFARFPWLADYSFEDS